MKKIYNLSICVDTETDEVEYIEEEISEGHRNITSLYDSLTQEEFEDMDMLTVFGLIKEIAEA